MCRDKTARLVHIAYLVQKLLVEFKANTYFANIFTPENVRQKMEQYHWHQSATPKKNESQPAIL
ncbi:hypothetical protein DSUL_50013 [Desulfovibrionales bacterium]